MNTPWAPDPGGKWGQVLKVIAIVRHALAYSSKLQEVPPAAPSLHAVLFSPPIIFGQGVDAAAPG